MSGEALFALLAKLALGAVIVATFFFVTLQVMDMYSPLLGQSVSYSISTSGKPQVCANAASEIVFEGKICSVSGSTVSVHWDSVANTSNAEAACGTEKRIKWYRRDDDSGWNTLFLGSCGRRPDYFENMPSEFDYSSLTALPGPR